MFLIPSLVPFLYHPLYSFLLSLNWIPPFLPCSSSPSALDVSSPRPPSFLTLITVRGDHHLPPCVAPWLMFSGPSHCFSFPAHLMAHKLKPKGLFRLAERSKPTLNRVQNQKEREKHRTENIKKKERKCNKNPEEKERRAMGQTPVCSVEGESSWKGRGCFGWKMLFQVSALCLMDLLRALISHQHQGWCAAFTAYLLVGTMPLWID